MAAIALAGASLFLLASFVVGFRLVALWYRTHQLPELMIGLSFLLAGGFGGVASIVGAELRVSRPGVSVPLLVIGSLMLHAGVMCLTVFVARVFRPGRGGEVAMAALCLALAVSGVGAVTDSLRGAGFWSGVSIAVRLGIYTWATVESGLQWTAARRRLRLGLADPAVVNRYLLWMVGIGSVTLLWCHSAWQMARGAVGPSAVTASYTVIAVLGMICAVSLWLAFFPPVAWLRRFEARRAAA